MLITKECDYAIRILRELSKSSICSVKDISSIEDIPLPYAYKICRKLSKDGYILSHRGVNGGYELTCDLNEVTLFDIFLSVDNDLQVHSCTIGGQKCSRNTNESICKVHTEFLRIQNLIYSELKRKKLSELL